MIKDNGRPCYPIELGFDIFDNEQYKDILEYWQRERSSGRLIFSAQLDEWKEFRRCQQRDRRIYVPRNWFHKFEEFLREGRRKYGLDGDSHLREEVTEQSKLDDWMEYQYYKLREYERFEERLQKVQEKLVFRRKALAEEGFSAFEEIEGLEFGKFFGMNLEWGDKEGEAKEKEQLAERKLRMVKTRSKAAQSEELGEKVERDRWIEWFVKEVESQRTTVDELQRVADKARRDVKPYEQWLKAKESELRATDSEHRWSDEVQRLFELEARTMEYRAKAHKRDELRKRAVEARSAHFCAEKELELAKELLEAARTEDLAPNVERAALIRRTQKEVRFAEFHVEEEKESRRVLNLKWGVLDNLYSISKLKGMMKRHNILLDWVEQQRRELIGNDANAEGESGSRRSKRVGSRAHPSLRAINASGVDHAAKKRIRPQKPLRAKSILDPVDPAKVTKTPKQKRKGRRRTSVSRDTARAAEKTNVDFNTAEPKSDEAVPVKDGMRRSVHSSRVSKPAPKRPIRRQKDTTRLSPTRDRHRQTEEEPLHMSILSKEVIDQSKNTSMQRSIRGSKRSQSLRLGSR